MMGYLKKRTEKCLICSTSLYDGMNYCPTCGFSLASSSRLHISDIVMNQSGVCTACAPTGFTECDCLTPNPTPRHMRKKPNPKPTTNKRPKPIPAAEPEDQQKRQTAPIPPHVRPAIKKSLIFRFVTAPFICLGAFIKAVFKIIAGLVTVALVVAVIGAFLYFFLFWLEHQR
jgi:hypothetical protein